MLKKNILSKFADHFSPDAQMILALSGGPDSIFLGELAYEFFRENLIVAHFNHALRPSADEEEKFSATWAKNKKLKFFTAKWHKPEKSEEKARQARYQFLYQIRSKEKAEAILLGSHLDDNAETIFFNFLRGTGSRGLSGMQTFDSENRKFRPLLNISKKEILAHLKKYKIKFIIDESNLENDFDRNYLRNEIFPLLEKRFPSFRGGLIRQSQIFREENDFVMTLVNDFLSQNATQKKHHWEIDKKSFLAQHKHLQAEILRQLFWPQTPSHENSQRLLKLISSAPSNKKMILKNKQLSVFSTQFFLEDV